MATIEKRKLDDSTISYRVKIRLKGHPPESATFSRITDARSWAQKTEADIKAGRHFGASRRHTLSELITSYVSSPQHKSLKSGKEMRSRLDWWQQHYGDRLLKDLTPSLIAQGRDALSEEYLTVVKRGSNGDVSRKPTQKKRSGATVNRFLAALSTALSFGVKELDWIERNPAMRISKLSEDSGRVRYLDSEELPRLLAACRNHDDLYLAVLLSLTTGGRQSEIMNLRWRNIDLDSGLATLQSGVTKNDDAKVMPLVGEALDLLKQRNKLYKESKVRILGDDRIFPPTAKASKAGSISLRSPFQTALKKACIQNFRWHDLRHTCASYLMMSGVSPLEISKILGHRSMSMVSRYAHLAPSRITDIGYALAQKMGVAE